MLIIFRHSISIFLLLLLLVPSAVAADLQKGMEAALRGDYAKALAEWLPLAEQGNFKAQYNIGVYYDKVLTKSEKEKAKFEQFSFIAGLSKTNGSDIFNKIKERLKIATDTNELITLKLYKNVLTSIKDSKTSAFFWFRKAAEQGYGPAQHNLGNAYYYGKVFKVDYSQAFYWYKKSTENNITGGQYNLGTMYYKGLGVKQNYSKAYYWLKKSSDRGDDKAQNLLAYLYYSGLGVEKNVEKTSQQNSSHNIKQKIKTVKKNIEQKDKKSIVNYDEASRKPVAFPKKFDWRLYAKIVNHPTVNNEEKSIDHFKKYAHNQSKLAKLYFRAIYSIPSLFDEDPYVDYLKTFGLELDKKTIEIEKLYPFFLKQAKINIL